MRSGHVRRFLASIVCVCMVVGTMFGVGTRPAGAGLISNVVEGKWLTLAGNTLERFTTYSLSTAASHANSETFSEVVKWTKRIISGNSGNIASETLAEVKEIHALLQDLYDFELNNSQSMEDMLNRIAASQAKSDFTNFAYDTVDTFGSRYKEVVSLYDTLLTSLIAYSETPNEATKSDLKTAYDNICTYYDDHTESQLFTDPLREDFLNVVSPYDSTQAIEKSDDVIDPAAWQLRSGIVSGSSYLERYYTYIKTVTSLENNLYDQMRAAANTVAVAGYNYVQAYRNYAELQSIIISGDASKSSSEKDAQISGIWSRFNQSALRVQRAINQMVYLYGGYANNPDVFGGYMRSYSIKNTVELNDYTSSDNCWDAFTDFQNHTGYGNIVFSTKGVVDDDFKGWKISNDAVTQKQMVYQFKLAGDNKAYAVREGNADGGSNKPIKNSDTYESRKINLYTTTFISYDLLSLMKGTTNGYEVIRSTDEISSITNPSNVPYSQEGLLTDYLKKELSYTVGDLRLPKVKAVESSSNGDTIDNGPNFLLLMSALHYNLSSAISGMGSDHDMWTTWANASMPSLGSTGIQLESEVREVSNSDFKDSEMVVVFQGRPTAKLTLDSSGGCAASIGGAASLSNAGSVNVVSGEGLTLTVTPDAGKTVDYIALLDGDGNELESFAADICAEDGSVVTTTQEYLDMTGDGSGTYTYTFPMPYKDAVAKVVCKDVDSSLLRYDVTLNDKYEGEDKVIVLQFDGYDYQSKKAFKAGDEVVVSACGYDGKIATAIELTREDGSAADVEVTDVTGDMKRIMPTERLYSFTMPAHNVRVSPVAQSSYTVTVNDDRSSHTFNDLNCYDTTLGGDTSWEKASKVDFAAGEPVSIAVTPDEGFVIDRVEVTSGRKRVETRVSDAGIEFTMPAGDTTVDVRTTREDVSTFLATIGEDSDVAYIQFSDEEGVALNVRSLQKEAGERVLFLFVRTDETSSSGPEVKDSLGREVAYSEVEGKEGLYAFTMPSDDVTLDIASKKKTKVRIADGEAAILHFADETGTISLDTSAYYAAGSTAVVHADDAAAMDETLTITDAVTSVDITHDVSVTQDKGAQNFSFTVPDTAEITLTLHHYVNGICQYCGHFETPALVDGIYQLRNAGNFLWFAAVVNDQPEHATFAAREVDACALMVRDIDLEGHPFDYIGLEEDASQAFAGTFDGGGHTIENFRADGSGRHCGMFGWVNGATITNFVVRGTIVAEDPDNEVYGLGLVHAGLKGSYPTLSHITSHVDISADEDAAVACIGGIYTGGELGSALIDHCVNYGNITTKNPNPNDQVVAGGIAGGPSDCTICDCVNFGTIDVCGQAGGIAGWCMRDTLLLEASSISELSRCVNFGSVKASGDDVVAGGIAGLASAARIMDCANVADVKVEGAGSDLYASGIADLRYATNSLVASCHNYGRISAPAWSHAVGVANGEAGGGQRFVENCFMLAETGTNLIYPSDVTEMSAEDFESGMVGFWLNFGKTDGSQAFYQDIDNEAAEAMGPDAYPLPFFETWYLEPVAAKGTIYEIVPDAQYSNYEGGKPQVVYSIETQTTGHGSVTLTKAGDGTVATSAEEGETILAEIVPAEGYRLKESSVTGRDSGTSYGEVGDSFVMPAEDVIVSVVFDYDYVDTVYEIYTFEDLQNAARDVLDDPVGHAGATYVLMNDIDCGGAEWTLPIGTFEVPFQGTFEGNDYIIQNLNIREYRDGHVLQEASDAATGTDTGALQGTETIFVGSQAEGTEEPAGAGDDLGSGVPGEPLGADDGLGSGVSEGEPGLETQGLESEPLGEDPAEDVLETEGTDDQPMGAAEVQEDADDSIEGISGLFGVIGPEGTVRHLSTLALTWAEDAEASGGIAAYNLGTIDYCGSGINIGSTGDESGYIDSDAIFGNLQNSIRASKTAGGIAAVNEGTISNSRNNSLVLDAEVSGGIAGANTGNILNFYNLGHVFGTSAEGGVAGKNDGTISIGYTAFAMEVSGTEHSGQVVGQTSVATLSDVYYNTAGNVSGDDRPNGDFAGVTARADSEIKSEAFAETLNAAAQGHGQQLGTWVYESTKNLGYPRIKSTVLVSKTFTDANGVTLSGQVHPDGRLEVVKLDGSSEDYRAIESALTDEELVGVYDISLRFENGRRATFEGELTVSIPAGSLKDLDTVLVVHRHFGELYDVAVSRLENGSAFVRINRLSAFGISKKRGATPTPSPEPTQPSGRPEPTVRPNGRMTPVDTLGGLPFLASAPYAPTSYRTYGTGTAAAPATSSQPVNAPIATPFVGTTPASGQTGTVPALGIATNAPAVVPATGVSSATGATSPAQVGTAAAGVTPLAKTGDADNAAGAVTALSSAVAMILVGLAVRRKEGRS